MPFVPDDFVVPESLDAGWCTLRPLQVGDNVDDFAAWHGSIDHIRSTPGFAGREWPLEDFTVERNAEDLAGHEADFAARRGFTYTVLSDADGSVAGCLYIYPPAEGAGPDVEADVRSWVRADHAGHDADLYEAVRAWLDAAWPFAAVAYAERA
jgi:hypothetical protein